MSEAERTLARGEVLRRALFASFRKTATALDSLDGLEDVSELLVASGSAGLVYRRLHASAGASGMALSSSLGQVFRKQVLDEAIRERNLEELLVALGRRGIEPVLIKGWAAAREYPVKGLRPYSDFDLAIKPHELEATCRALLDLGVTAIDLPDGIARPSYLGAARPLPGQAADPTQVSVDLHFGHARLADRDPVELRRRLQRLPLRSTEVAVLGPEDHLRLIALHLFEHATWRTLCLVDVAVLVERCAATLDWEYLETGDPHRSEAVSVALALARDLLGASLGAASVGRATARGLRLKAPRWAREALLGAWGAGPNPYGLLEDEPPSLRTLARALRHRWRNPLIATFVMRGRFNDWPRLPYQTADVLTRAFRYMKKKLSRR